MPITHIGRSICLICILAGLAGIARADDTPATRPANDRPAGRLDPDTMIQRFRDELATMKLTDDQKQKVDEAMTKAEQSLKLLDSELQNATQSQRMQRVREIFNDLREQVRSALTPEQQQELRSKISSGATDRLQRLREAMQKLGLSDEQKEKIKSLFEDLRGKMEAARKEGAAGGQEAAEKLRAAGADLRAKLAEILTDEQREKLRDLMESNAAPATQPAAK
jgi:Spy/CpxP family protein refolding chaperone